MANKTYADLKDEFDERVEKLREECDHPEVSDWQEEWWAIGHTTGFEVRVCEICQKIVARRTRCAKCGKFVEEDNFKRGDGTRRPASEIFCPECQEEWEEFVRRREGRHLPDGSSVKEEENLTEGLHYMRLHRKFLESPD
ncbi:hypothetical protein AKJ62_01370 [candidate division MSBL1 archaeon SCGC-AAA259D14]|uniref:Uncharacterized protein n=1 Tax=candidate division MSBL1 archaeon SCGC-AAA259D14 TaxID=1698261 RepID=A0A133U7R9_9EURY|nr:hypothetical protein AKJ62_01370 [candidate division MSBL1 archaeon SCGC-AAA259D14]